MGYYNCNLDVETPSSWEEENAIPPEALCEWSLEPSARIATTRGIVPQRFGTNQMQKSASIAFSDTNDLYQQPPQAPRLRKFDSVSNNYNKHQPFLRGKHRK